MDELTETGAEEFMNLLLESTDLAEFLQRLTEVCAAELSVHSEAHCSVTVERERRSATVAHSSEAAERMDELQYSCGEGPCQDALVTGQLIEVPDLLTDPRYPRYRKAMAETGIRSVLGVPIPLPTASHSSAALNCYTQGPDGFPEELRARAEELARLASRSVLVAIRVANESERTADLADSLQSRSAIGLAVGIVMSQTGCSQDEAMETLKDAARNGGLTLGDAASALLADFGDGDARARAT